MSDPDTLHKRVLLVEDEALIALDLERRLVRMGFDVVGVADNGEDARRLYAAERPEIVLMDISLRGSTDGIATAQNLLQIGEPLIVFLTAYADEATVRRAASVSPHGYLLKPFDERTIWATLTLALQRFATERRTRLLRAAVEGVAVGIALVEAEGDRRVVTYANDALAGICGAPRDSLLGHPPLLLDGTTDAHSTLQQAIDARTSASALIDVPAHDAEPARSLSVTVSPVPRPTGGVGHLVVVYQDRTRERTAEAALAQAQRIELAGRLSAGIAHDFNNVLSVIAGTAEIVREETTDDAHRADLDEILVATRRGQGLTRKLLDFARRNEDAPTACTDAALVLMEARTIAERLAGARITFEMIIQDAPMFVAADPTSLEQILLNLVANARDAMPRGGRLQVSLSRPDTAAGPLRPGRYARIEVADEGEGMSEAVAAQVFEPLFTTKPRGAGTGLGLTTCKMLVERAGGRIATHPGASIGTVFTVDLPLVSGGLDEPEAAPTTGAGGALCLLVEDEAALRRVYAHTLSEAGFEVVDVASGEEAIEALDRLRDQVRLVVCDMLLPRIGGAEVLAHATRVSPQVGRLIVTGFFDGATPDGLRDVEILWKPFPAGTLAARALARVRPADLGG